MHAKTRAFLPGCLAVILMLCCIAVSRGIANSTGEGLTDSPTRRLPSSSPPLLASSPSRPSIVFVLADDLGYGDLGCYNKDSKIPTPNLDRLAAEGIRFTDAHSPSSVCTPTRYALLTGRYSWRGRLQRGVLGPWDGPLIERGRPTVASFLKEHGYATACIGKWHLGWEWPTKDGRAPSSGPDRLSNVDFTKPIPGGPTTSGFDSYFGVDVPNYPPYCFIENDRTVGIPSLPDGGREDGFNRPGPMLPGWRLVDILPELTRRAVRYIEDAGGSARPFFLYLPLTSPHYPVVPAPEFKGKSKAGDYGDFVHQTDWTVGRVLDALERTGAAGRTLVIFTSDNGPEVTGEVDPGAYDRLREFGHSSMNGLRGAKRDIWEGGHRVPFLARWPGKIPPGAVSEETICHVDLMATVAALLGAKLRDDAGEDSHDILPALLGRKLVMPVREATVHHGGSGRFAIRKGDWVLLDHSTGDDNGERGEPEWFRQERGCVRHDQPGELYDLRRDLAETRNLYAEDPLKVHELKDLLETLKREGRSAPPTPVPGLKGAGATAAAGGAVPAEPGEAAAERRELQSGIEIPGEWPPERRGTLPRDPEEPPYLRSPPSVISIDVGRQLLVDDFLIESTTLKRTFHRARYLDEKPSKDGEGSGCVVLRPDRPWEMTSPSPCAMVFSDGVFHDPRDGLYKMWYMAGYTAGTGYATSRDGIRWEKPVLDVFPGTNLVQKGNRDSSTIWLDHEAKEPGARFKMAYYTGGALRLSISPDGIHWSEPVQSGPTGDRSTFSRDPFRGSWVFSLRAGIPGDPRVRRYWEAPDFLRDCRWKPEEPRLWVGADNLDPRRADLDTQPQLYNLDCVAYESLILGLFTIWRGQPRDRPKPNEICLGFSRDGFHWSRPDRRPFLPVSERQGDWNWGNVQSAGGGCLVVGDELRFYVSARAGVPGTTTSGECATGLAVLRRDGFASLDAPTEPGQLTTRPLRFRGKYLFVNASVGPGGSVRAEVLDEAGRAIEPFTLGGCEPVREDRTCCRVNWRGVTDLSAARGRTVRLRFEVTKGSLYSFWVSPLESGASLGRVAAGGPGFNGAVDDPGIRSGEHGPEAGGGR